MARQQRISTCEKCGQAFQGWPGNVSRFCSHPCYWEWRRTRDVFDVFLRRFEVNESGCWLWTHSIGSAGYAQFTTGRQKLGHIYSYTQYKGEVPVGMELDHLCRVRHCVNPEHLEAVTHRVNALRGESPWARNARRTHCVNGHELSGANLLWCKTGRRCRECKLEGVRALRRRNKEAAQ